jgi:hypothetical protein
MPPGPRRADLNWLHGHQNVPVPRGHWNVGQARNLAHTARQHPQIIEVFLPAVDVPQHERRMHLFGYDRFRGVGPRPWGRHFPRCRVGNCRGFRDDHISEVDIQPHRNARTSPAPRRDTSGRQRPLDRLHGPRDGYGPRYPVAGWRSGLSAHEEEATGLTARTSVMPSKSPLFSRDRT